VVYWEAAMKKQPESDPLLEELDEARQRIWDECGRDEDTYFAMLIEGQEQLRRKGWKFSAPREPAGKSAVWPPAVSHNR
jgi:hypothetical protein